MTWAFLDTCKCVLHEQSKTLIIHCKKHNTFQAAVKDNKSKKFDNSPRSKTEEDEFKKFMNKINDVSENAKLEKKMKDLS